MANRRPWVAREGFTLDTVQQIILNTALNPFLTLPLFLFAKYTDRGRLHVADHQLALRRLKWLTYVALARWASSLLSQAGQNNFSRANQDWHKEIVLISGGSDGFGKLLVRLFANHNKNTKIISLDVQKPTFESPSPNFHHVDCDLSSDDAIEEAAKHVKEAHGDPTVVIMNAGIIRPSTILGMQDSNLEKMFQVNCFQHYRLMRRFLPDMVAKNHGIVVTVASLAGYLTPAGATDYCGTKAAAVAFHEGLTAELRDRYSAPKVRTICVTPNFAHTKLAVGLKNEKSFLSPWLAPETVAEGIFDKVISGNGGFVCIPKSHGFIGQMMRAYPYWIQKYMSTELATAMEDVDGWKK